VGISENRRPSDRRSRSYKTETNRTDRDRPRPRPTEDRSVGPRMGFGKAGRSSVGLE